MSITMLQSAVEESTFIVRMDFFDTEGNAKAPATMSWSLFDENNRIVNEREDVNISSPDIYEEIVLSADDLKLYGQGNGKRVFVAEGTYYSVAYGNNLPLKGSCDFIVKQL